MLIFVGLQGYKFRYPWSRSFSWYQNLKGQQCCVVTQIQQHQTVFALSSVLLPTQARLKSQPYCCSFKERVGRWMFHLSVPGVPVPFVLVLSSWGSDRMFPCPCLEAALREQVTLLFLLRE